MPHRSLLFSACAILLTAAGSGSGALAQSSNRVFEIRTYTTAPGKLEALKARFRDHTIDIFNRHGMTSIGYWIPRDPPLAPNTLIYILAHPSREAAKQHWAEFGADPEWQKVKAASEANGKLVLKVVSIYADPADFSSIR